MNIRKIIRINYQCFLLYSIFFTLFYSIPVTAAPWWISEQTEETKSVENGITYKRILYQTPENLPVRAHILSVTGMGSDYLFGVLGSYGVLFTASNYAKNSDAAAVINGGFFSVNPNRANGFVMAHGKALYPFPSSAKSVPCVGFTPKTLLIDTIQAEDIKAKNNTPADTAGWSECYSALSAGPLLLKNGESHILDVTDSYNLTAKAPRTAIAKTKDNEALLVVIDGRQPDWSNGVTLEELAIFMKHAGAMDALNLDGGGSSTMVINKQLVNRPSEGAVSGNPGSERQVANVIAIIRKR